ncbi:MAG TPA: L,D-transpeptidase family protein [Gemmatimonadales bacterium]
MTRSAGLPVRWALLAVAVACTHRGATPAAAPIGPEAMVADPASPSMADQPIAAAPVSGLHLELNVAALRLDVYDGTAVVRRYRVAVGGADHPTPLGTYHIRRVEWNPVWVPPPSEWAQADTVMRPGPTNPMGRVKLEFRDRYFLHGTPDPTSVGTAGSHGCVRLANQDALELAERVHAYASPDLRSGDVTALASGWGTTRSITLVRDVPLVIRYAPIEVVGSYLVAHPDVYGRRSGSGVPDALAGLAAAGLDAWRADTATIRALLAESPTRTVSVSLASLLKPR